MQRVYRRFFQGISKVIKNKLLRIFNFAFVFKTFKLNCANFKILFQKMFSCHTESYRASQNIIKGRQKMRNFYPIALAKAHLFSFKSIAAFSRVKFTQTISRHCCCCLFWVCNKSFFSLSSLLLSILIKIEGKEGSRDAFELLNITKKWWGIQWTKKLLS